MGLQSNTIKEEEQRSGSTAGRDAGDSDNRALMKNDFR